MIFGLPWYSFLIWAGFGLAGFLLGWLLEWIWWRRPYAESFKRSYDLETEVQAAHKEVELARTGTIFQDVRAELDDALQAKSKLETDLTARTHELSGLHTQVAGLRSEYVQLKGEHDARLAEIAQIKADWQARFDAMQGGWSRRYQVKEVELARTLADGQTHLHARTAELDDANARITLLQNDYAELEARHAAERDQLQAGLHAKEQELGLFKTDYDQRSKTAEDEHGNTRGTLGLMQTQFDRAQTEHAGRQVEFEALSLALTAKIASAEHALAAQEDQAFQLKADLEARLQARDAELAEASLRMQSLQDEHDALSGEHDNKVGEVARFVAGAVVASAALKGRDDEIVTLTGRVSELELARLGDAHGSKIGEVATLTAGAAATMAAMNGKDEEIAALTARVGELEAVLNRKAELENKLIRKDAELARLSAEWNARLKVKDDEL